MAEIHTGGCQCGRVRYQTQGQPAKSGACHCRYCQTRTGSAFGLSVYFERDKVTRLSGELKEYGFTTESGRRFTTEFCTHCGTSVFWTLELSDGLIGVAGGTYDPPTFWFPMGREVFCRSKAAFVHLDVAERFETTSTYAPTGDAADEDRLSGG